ncbi:MULTISPECIES: hypothetical protein [unclassified Xanthobacter]|uniref:hypothetical protein n=1 Tax=unclassified Xanthobacter TaxID=2623496 RepID=UPI001F36A970|nr:MULTISPECIES: hypothetical protein [unclassified Xanthobacter]
MNFKYNINRLVAVEKLLGKPMPDVLAELQGETGASLQTTQALVAAGTANEMFMAHSPHLSDWDLRRANELIESQGLAAVGAAIGAGLKDFMAKVA